MITRLETCEQILYTRGEEVYRMKAEWDTLHRLVRQMTKEVKHMKDYGNLHKYLNGYQQA